MFEILWTAGKPSATFLSKSLLTWEHAEREKERLFKKKSQVSLSKHTCKNLREEVQKAETLRRASLGKELRIVRTGKRLTSTKPRKFFSWCPPPEDEYHFTKNTNLFLLSDTSTSSRLSTWSSRRRSSCNWSGRRLTRFGNLESGVSCGFDLFLVLFIEILLVEAVITLEFLQVLQESRIKDVYRNFSCWGRSNSGIFSGPTRIKNQGLRIKDQKSRIKN